MTRLRNPHKFHEVPVHDPESICSKCGSETPKICEWCGECYSCHYGIKERDY